MSLGMCSAFLAVFSVGVLVGGLLNEVFSKTKVRVKTVEKLRTCVEYVWPQKMYQVGASDKHRAKNCLHFYKKCSYVRNRSDAVKLRICIECETKAQKSRSPSPPELASDSSE